MNNTRDRYRGTRWHVDDQIRENWPEFHRLIGQVRTEMADPWVFRNHSQCKTDVTKDIAGEMRSASSCQIAPDIVEIALRFGR